MLNDIFTLKTCFSNSLTEENIKNNNTRYIYNFYGTLINCSLYVLDIIFGANTGFFQQRQKYLFSFLIPLPFPRLFILGKGKKEQDIYAKYLNNK